jgi:Uma2 family endonuclease
MATTAASEPLPTTLQTVEEFEAWERQHAPEGSYEFVRGRIIEKDSMKQAEYLLIKFLTRLFATTAAYRQGDELTPEMDSYVDDVRKRRPDLAYFTFDQIEATRTGARQSTRFAIEILSESESHEDVLEKIQDYFDGGAVLVWYLVPKRRKIYAYTSPEELKVFKSTDRISAAPLLPDFAFGVAEVFG